MDRLQRLNVEPIREVIRRAPEQAKRMDMSRDQAEFYNQGWVVPDDHINWTHYLFYLFYGADVRTYHSDYIRAQLEEIARLWEEEDGYVDYPEGAFYSRNAPALPFSDLFVPRLPKLVTRNS